MGKRIEIDGKFYRRRRGKLVEIPSEWVGHTLDPQTKRKRASKHPRKDRLRVDGIRRPRSQRNTGMRNHGSPHPSNQTPRHSEVARAVDRRDRPEDAEG